MSGAVGDDTLGLPVDTPGAHGIAEERVKSHVRGYGFGSLVGCQLPLNYANCFRIDGEGGYDFDQTVVNLGDTADARRRMEIWGWDSNEYRQYGCDTPPEGHVGWVEISIHRFNSAQSAQQAADYFAVQRMADTPLNYAPPLYIGDYAVAVSGPAGNGVEYTTYVASGSNLLRVTGVAPVGIPQDDVFTIAEDMAGVRNP